MTRLPHFRPLPLLLAGLLALAPLHRAQAEPAPQTIGGEPVVQMVAGVIHSCARVESGLVYCWGQNYEGQIGDGTRQDRRRPVQVLGLTEVIDITAGSGHNCALRRNGRVFCWGQNDYGQLGNGLTTNRVNPVRVAGLNRITGVAVGDYHTCALRDTGRVFCWGSNHFGQLGDGTTTSRATPVRVAGPWSNQAAQVAAGSRHNCLLNATGRVACWGANVSGQLGDGTTVQRLIPVPVSALTRVTRIGVGGFHNCALRDTGQVFCWGANGVGELGDGSVTNSSVPVRVQGLTAVTDVAAGNTHSCALRNTGRVFCWGGNHYGQLGDGTTAIRQLTPVRVVGPLVVNVGQITAGSFHSCAIRPNGRAYCWGLNNVGQIGDGTTDNRLTPVRVAD